LNNTYISILDIILTPIYVIIILAIANYKKNKHISENPIYKYYVKGLAVKIFAGIIFCLIYVYYYGGGDTLFYYNGAKCFSNLLFRSPEKFIKVFINGPEEKYYDMFDFIVGYPPLWLYKEIYALNVMKITTVFLILSFQSYIVATILMSWVVYSGIWRLYVMFCELYPTLYNHFAVAVLFVPSVVFWGSGILKDPISLSAMCWYTYSLYELFVKKRNIYTNILRYVLSLYFIFAVKPYILYAIIPGSILWISYDKIKSIKSGFVRFLVAPSIIAIAFFALAFFYNTLGDKLGKFSVDQALERAVITQQDMAHNKLYGENKFDIGEFPPTIPGVLSKFPQAVVAGIFRPFLWEARTPFSLISGIENLYFLFLTLFIIIKVGLRKTFGYITTNPLVFFCLLFSIFFSFIVGLTTANFGALVRYKIPLIPLYLSSLFLMHYLYHKEVKEND